MKKLILFSIIFVAFCFNVKGQNAYYDALYLAKNKNRILEEGTIANLSNPAIITISIDDQRIKKTIEELVGINTSPLGGFLKEPIGSYSTIKIHQTKIDVEIFLKKFNPFAPMGLPASESIITTSNIADGVTLPTKIVDATAQFLVDRVKQELTLAFFDKFRSKLDSLPELKIMLPHTYIFLKTTNYFDTPSLGKAWIEAFKADLEKLPQDFERLIGERYPDIAEKEEFKLFLITYHTLDLLSKKTHPAHIIEYLNTTYTILPITPSDKLSQSLNMLQLLSENLKTEENINNKIWIDDNDFKKLKFEGAEYFVGLLYQQEKSGLFNSILFSDGITTLSSWITNDKVKIDKFIQNTSQLVTLFTTIQTQIDDINRTLDKETKLIKYLEYAKISSDLIDLGFRFRYLFDFKSDYYQSDYYKKWKPIGDNTINTLQAVNDKNYGGILVHGLGLLKPFFERDIKNKLMELENDLLILNSPLVASDTNKLKNILNKTQQSLEEKVTVAIVGNDFTKFVSDFKREITNINIPGNDNKLKEKLAIIRQIVSQRNTKKDFIEIFDKLAFFGNFIVDVVSVASDTSKTAKEISLVINKYAQPVGSYSVKRKSISSIDINAYPGLYAGWENTIYDKSTPNANSKSAVFTNGLTVPIGIAFSWGLKNCKTKKLDHSSFSLFLPIIDIAAAFSFRWGNDSARSLPANIKWEQILSPGIHAIYGIKNIPVSIMAGFQLTPRLRDFNDNQNLANMIRYGITIAVDIPLFNLRRKEDEEN